MRAREIVLLIFIIAAGVLLTQSDKGHINWNWGWEDWDGPFFGLSHEAAVQESKTFNPPLPEGLVVANSHGSIEVQPATDGKITVLLETKAFRRSEEEARQAAQQVHLTVSQEGSKLVLSTNRDELGHRRFETTFRLSVPEGLAVDLRNSYGQVKTANTGRTDITNSHGPVSAVGVRGPFTAITSYDDVEVKDAAAECRIECRHGSVAVLRIQGRVEVIDHYGEVRVEETGAEAVITGTHMEVIGLKVAGSVKVETTYRDISLEGTGPATITGHHSAVGAKDINGSLSITDSYGRVELQNIQGSVTVRGRSLEVMGRTLAGPEIIIATSYQNIDLAGFSGKTDISQAHGSVRLEPTQVSGDLTVRAEYADIRLALPAGAANPIQAQTRYGAIRWKLPVKPDLEQKDGLTVVKGFGREQGKPRIDLSTSYADIIIETGGQASGEVI